MRILVTGGGGFIGSHLMARLIERGDDVRLLDDFATGRRSSVAYRLLCWEMRRGLAGTGRIALGGAVSVGSVAVCGACCQGAGA